MDSNIIRELIIKKENGQKIYGQFYFPSCQQEQYKTVILSHGFAQTHHDLKNYAQRLSQHGYGAYIFDFIGGAPYSKSDGSMLEMSVLTEKEDLEYVIEYLSKQSYVDSKNIILLGASQGGLVSSLLAPSYPFIRGLILLYPAFVIVDDVKKVYPTKEDIPQVPKEKFGIKVGKKYYEDVIDMDVYKEIKGFDKDVLMIHGSSDYIVPLRYVQKALQAYPKGKLIEIKNAGHVFHGHAFEKSMEEILKYLNRICPSND